MAEKWRIIQTISLIKIADTVLGRLESQFSILLLTHLNSNTNTSTVTLNFSHPTRSSNFVWVFKQRLFYIELHFLTKILGEKGFNES